MSVVSVVDRFAGQVARVPDAVAVCEAGGGGEVLSYSELEVRANRLAHRLIGLGVGREDPVAVLMQRSADVVVAFLAVLKAGGVFLPLHEADPVERRQWVVDHSAAVVMVVDEVMLAAGVPGGVPVVSVSDPGLASEPAGDPGVEVLPGQLAYVIHTSGSTGQPKGVAVTQQDLVRLFDDPQWELSRHERVLLVAPYAFDVSMYEIWMPLLHGGQVVIAPPGRLEAPLLQELIDKYQITGMHLTAGLFRVIAEEAPQILSGLREVLTGGDVIAATAVRQVLQACPGLVVHALYGATEATVFSAHHLIGADTDLGSNVPVGAPLTAITIHILDQHLAPVPAGTVGEIYLGGQGLARGYLDQPVLTAERFVPDPFGGPGSRMYRSGDLARRTSDGLIEFAGRHDSQVKILGFLVDLTEVEAALADYPGLAQIVVLAHEHSDGNKQLTGYAVSTNGDDLDLAALRAHASTKLPGYMCPTTFIQLTHLPLTPNGKLDRAAMPEPDRNHTPASRPPQTPLQQTLCDIFSSLLDVPHIGIDDSFFELGGQSLQAMRLCTRIGNTVGVGISMNTLFDSPTVAQLATYISTRQGTNQDSTLSR